MNLQHLKKIKRKYFKSWSHYAVLLLFCQNVFPMRVRMITHILLELQPIMVFSPVANFGHHPLEPKTCSIKQTCTTGKSVSEALILESVNPQYDNRLFINLGLQYKKIQVQNMLSTKIVLCFRFGIQNNFCKEHVLNIYLVLNL